MLPGKASSEPRVLAGLKISPSVQVQSHLHHRHLGAQGVQGRGMRNKSRPWFITHPCHRESQAQPTWLAVWDLGQMKGGASLVVSILIFPGKQGVGLLLGIGTDCFYNCCGQRLENACVTVHVPRAHIVLSPPIFFLENSRSRGNI